MRKRLLPFLALLAGVGLAQTWTDHRGLTATFQSLRALTSKSPKRHLSMIGKVEIVSVPQGLTMRSDTMDIDAVPDPKNPNAYLVQSAQSKGHVSILKQVKGAKGLQTTKIDGTQADYLAGTVESVIKMTGPVNLVSLDEQQRQTLAATGKTATAYMEPAAKTSLDDGLRRAQMDGDVHLTLVQRDAQTKQATLIRAYSDHMLVENIGKGRRVTLTGNVKVFTDSNVELSGIQKAVLTQDANGVYALHTSEQP